MKIISLAISLACLASSCCAIDPIVLKTTPVVRSTRQIMQGAPVITDAPPRTPQSIVGKPGSPTVLDHFLVADYQESGQYGPSGEAATGSTQVLVASKGRIRSFTKTGTIDNVLNLTHDAFFSPISRGGFTADPNVIFHPQWKQWIIFGDAFLESTLVLAISDTDIITPETLWSFYVVDKKANEGFSPSAFLDYTTLGTDERAIYCAANILNFNDTEFFTSAAAYVIPRSSLTCGEEATIYAWRELRDLGPQEVSPFTLWPAINFDNAPTAGYFISIPLEPAFTGFATSFLVNIVTYTNQDVPTLSDPIEIPVEPYAAPITVPALGTPATHIISPVASFRLTPTHIRNNRLWLLTNIGVNNEGVSELPVAVPPDGTLTRSAARFTQIDVSFIETDPVNAVVSQGTLFQATPTNELGARSFLTPALLSNELGDVIIGATTCAANERINAAIAPLIENNTAVGEPVLYTTSTSDYYATEDWEFNPFARWGDHTRVAHDPEDPSVLWTTQQWCSAPNTWGLEVAAIKIKKD